MTDYLNEAYKEFAVLSAGAHKVWMKQKSEGAKQVAYKNFCE